MEKLGGPLRICNHNDIGIPCVNSRWPIGFNGFSMQNYINFFTSYSINAIAQESICVLVLILVFTEGDIQAFHKSC